MKQKTAKLIDCREYFEKRRRDVEEGRAAGELRLDSLNCHKTNAIACKFAAKVAAT